MNRRQQSGPRLTGLKSAHRRAKDEDEITLDTMASLWGCSKGQMVKIRDAIIGFPAHRTGPKGILLYPARLALKSLIDEETKDDREAAALLARQAKMLGRKHVPNARPALNISISEMAQLARMSAEIEEREREQGLYVPVQPDPNGKLPAAVRAAIDAGGRDVLLKIHAEMKHMLAGDAPARRRNAETARAPTGRAGRTQTRRKR
jgi:hypothetical protein